MNSQWIKLALVIALTGMAATAFAQPQPQVINVPLSQPGEPIRLSIDILSADIEVIGEDREDAQFEVSVLEGPRKIITPSGTKSLNIGAYSVEVEERNNRISVETDWRADRVRVVARIPRRADLELSTVNNGTIRVQDVTGALNLQNVNGPITATGISGSVIAESVNDHIEVMFDRVEEGSAMSLQSVNGNLTLGLPEGTGAEFHIDSAEGQIVSDFEVEVAASEPVISREDGRSGVEVRVESVIVARLGGGGTVYKLKTLNGNIHIKKSR